MYLVNSWDKDDKRRNNAVVFNTTPQISPTRLNQGLPYAQLYATAISLRIDGF